MKRVNNIYPKICTIENLMLADIKARKGKLRSIGVRIHDRNRDANIQAHQSQESWNPEITLGTLWQVVVTTKEWTVGVAYKVNDIVTYQGKTYKCLQAHTSQAGWTPSVVPALWKLQ
jgi:hypothetical protein